MSDPQLDLQLSEGRKSMPSMDAQLLREKMALHEAPPKIDHPKIDHGVPWMTAGGVSEIAQQDSGDGRGAQSDRGTLPHR